MKKKNLLLPVLIGLVIVTSLLTAGYFYQQYQILKANPQLVAQSEVDDVVNTIQKYMDLPTDETPTLVTVLDKTKLTGQNFFKNAENGDKILVYTKAQKAILFRPSTGRIIDFAPIVIGTPSPASPPTPTTKVTPT